MGSCNLCNCPYINRSSLFGLLLWLALALGACLLTNLQRSLLQILTAEERKVTVVGEAIHLDDALKRHIGLGKQTLNLDDALLLHPAVRSIVELLLEHIIKVLNAETTDIGKLLYGLNAWCIVSHERHERLVTVEEVVECTELNLRRVEELEDDLKEAKRDYEDLEQDLEDNYKPISLKEMYGVSDRDFI